MNTEIIVEHRADGSVCISSKEFRDGFKKMVDEYPGGEDAFKAMIKRGFGQPHPRRESLVIERPK